ncbi:hypothetical protein M3J09_009138 [Ascochyta lentis]
MEPPREGGERWVNPQPEWPIILHIPQTGGKKLEQMFTFHSEEVPEDVSQNTRDVFEHEQT